MRRGETLALAWGDLDLEHADLTVSRNFIRDITGEWILGEPKTRAGFRGIPLADDMVALLRAHRLEEKCWFGLRTDEHPVFTHSSGERLDPSNVVRLFHRLVREAVVPRSRFHDLWHTAASLLIRRGCPPRWSATDWDTPTWPSRSAYTPTSTTTSAGPPPFRSASCCRRNPQSLSPQVSETNWWLNCSS